MDVSGGFKLKLNYFFIINQVKNMTTFNKEISILKFSNKSFENVETTISELEKIFDKDVCGTETINVFIANINGGVVDNYNAIIGYLKTIKTINGLKFSLFASGYIMSAGINILASDIFDEIYVDSNIRIMIHQFGATINDRQFRNKDEVDKLKDQIDHGESIQDAQLYKLQRKFTTNLDQLLSVSSNLKELLNKKKSGDVNLTASEWHMLKLCTHII